MSPPKSAYARDFVGYGVPGRGAPKQPPKAVRLPGAKWLPTEYNTAYLGRPAYARAAPPPFAGDASDFEPVPAAPTLGVTTYASHYVAHPLQGARKVFVDPEDRAGDDVSVVTAA